MARMLDLDGLEIDRLEFVSHADGSLESLGTGQAMTELGASLACPVSSCSCCVSCCCCCCGG